MIFSPYFSHFPAVTEVNKAPPPVQLHDRLTAMDPKGSDIAKFQARVIQWMSEEAAGS